jgi:hypothetical protein
MNPRSAIAALLVVAGFLSAHAQDVALPARDNDAPADAERPLPTPAPQLIPDDLLPAPDVSPAPERPEIPTIPEIDQEFTTGPRPPQVDLRRKHLEWRKLRNRAQNDPEVKAALAAAEAARTDLQKRKLLARYVEVYFAKMLASAPADMKPYLLERKGEHLAKLPQPRVRPGVLPLPPPATGAATAPPSPKPAVASPDLPLPSFFGSPTPRPAATPAPSP